VDELQLDQQQQRFGGSSKERSSKRVSSTVKAQREFLEQLRRSSSVGEGLNSSGSGCGLYQPGAAAAPAGYAAAAVPGAFDGFMPEKLGSPLRRVTGGNGVGLGVQQGNGAAAADTSNVLAMLQQVVQLQQLVQQQQSVASSQAGTGAVVGSPVVAATGSNASRRSSKKQQQGLQPPDIAAEAAAGQQPQQQSGRKSHQQHRRQRSGAVMSRVSSNLSQMLALSVSGSSDADEALELRGSLDAAGHEIMQQLSSESV
jgi:hypothetical protein